MLVRQRIGLDVKGEGADTSCSLCQRDHSTHIGVCGGGAGGGNPRLAMDMLEVAAVWLQASDTNADGQRCASHLELHCAGHTGTVELDDVCTVALGRLGGRGGWPGARAAALRQDR